MNRKQRRNMMRKIGMFKHKSPYVSLAVKGQKDSGLTYPWNEKVRRALSAGESLRMQFLSTVETNLNNAAIEKQAATIANLVASGYTEEKATEIVNRNYQIENDREEMLMNRSIARNNVKNAKLVGAI